MSHFPPDKPLERFDSKRVQIRFRMRQIARHTKALAKLLLGMKEPLPPVSPLHPEVPDSEKHPSLACPCECGPDAPHAEHRFDCPWAAEMCLHCDGHGYCPKCLGDGTDPAHITSPAGTTA